MRYIVNDRLVLMRPPEGPLAACIRPFSDWVRLLPTCPPVYVLVARRLYPSSFAGNATPAEAPTGSRPLPRRSQTMAECLLRRSWAFHDVRSPPISAPIPMRKQLTGEPVAGKLHIGFGGRGRCMPFPTPILGSRTDISAEHLPTGACREVHPALPARGAVGGNAELAAV